MKHTIIATAMLLGSVLCAQAGHSDDGYHDLRPNGHKRSDAVFNADVAACKRRTHDSLYHADSPAMKRCMLTRGYQWESTTWVRDRRSAPPSDDKVDWTDFLKWEQ